MHYDMGNTPKIAYVCLEMHFESLVSSNHRLPTYPQCILKGKSSKITIHFALVDPSNMLSLMTTDWAVRVISAITSEGFEYGFCCGIWGIWNILVNLDHFPK